MNFLELAEKRYSVRDYADKNVEEEKLKKNSCCRSRCTDGCQSSAGQTFGAPNERTACKTGKICKYLSCTIGNRCMFRHGKAWTRPYDGKQTTDIDASIITDHMMLEATDLDLGSVWIGIFKPERNQRRNSICQLIWSQSAF